MMKYAFLLCTLPFLLFACKHDPDNPYRNYRVTDDEAIPASRIGGAPYKR